MRKFFQQIFRPFFTWLAEKLGDAPRQADVFKSLSGLYKHLLGKSTGRGIVVHFNPAVDRFIIFSDQHKGTRGFDDDFQSNEGNYIAALQYYHEQSFSFINLGDGEELWKHKADAITAAYTVALMEEAKFHAGKRYYRTFGNHDLLWKNSLDVQLYLKDIFSLPLPVYEGIILRTTGDGYPPFDIFCTHGHQGDKMSDGNAFSTWVIAHIWAPVQRFLQLNINTPANDFTLRSKHNRLMYEWSVDQPNLLLITGHTHKPVFASGKYASSPAHTINAGYDTANIQPGYFNTGCCCYNDGDITGIEIADGFIRLIKWFNRNGVPGRAVLEEKQLLQVISNRH